MIDAVNEIKREEKENREKMNQNKGKENEETNELFTKTVNEEIKTFQENATFVKYNFDCDNDEKENSISLSIMNRIKFLENLPKGKVQTVTDLGCGGLYDTEYLIKQGYNVTAIDANLDEKRQREVISSLTNEQKNNVSIEQQYFENLNLPKTDLLYTFYSLPYFLHLIVNISFFQFGH